MVNLKNPSTSFAFADIITGKCLRNITTDRFDYKKLGRATADAIGKSGLKITIDDRELGRIVKGYN